MWADGKPMSHPEYNLDLGNRPEGPPLLTKDINKAVQPSTITAFKERYAEAMDREDFDQAWGSTPQPSYTMPHYQNEDQEQQKWNDYSRGENNSLGTSKEHHDKYHTSIHSYPFACRHCQDGDFGRNI
jgi:hypothetical protein